MTVPNLGSCKKCDAADLIKKLGLEFAIYKREYRSIYSITYLPTQSKIMRKNAEGICSSPQGLVSSGKWLLEIFPNTPIQ